MQKASWLALILVFCGCRPTESEEQIDIIHYNIHFVSDLTNRIEKKEEKNLLHDTAIINEFIDLYHPLIFEHQRAIEQKDILQYSRISKYNAPNVKQTYRVSLGDFPNQMKRITYVKDGDLKKDLANLKQTVAYNYQTRGTTSGDIISFFRNEISEFKLKTDTVTSESEGTLFSHYHKNVVILFTDGYLETGDYNRKKDCKANKCRFLNQQLINEIRKKAETEGLTVNQVIEEFDYGILPVDNPKMKYLDVIVLEVFDRSLKSSGSSSVMINDFEIIDAVWRKWMRESGAKSIKLYQVINDVDRVKGIIEKDILYHSN